MVIGRWTPLTFAQGDYRHRGESTCLPSWPASGQSAKRSNDIEADQAPEDNPLQGSAKSRWSQIAVGLLSSKVSACVNYVYSWV